MMALRVMVVRSCSDSPGRIRGRGILAVSWQKEEGVQRAIMDYFIGFLMEFTPGEAMAVGALVGLLPLLLLFVRRYPRPSADGEEDIADSAAEPPTPSAHDRLLTCVICKHPVKMSAFAAHVARHDTEDYVSPPRPPAASNGQPPRPPTATKFPRPPRS
jgi:hypothetical protein